MKSASKAVTINDVVVPVSLQSIQITGANSVDENTTSNFLATAFFSDGSTSSVTASSTWSEDSSFATISNVGVLSASEVTTNQPVNVSASYTFSGVTKSASKAVTINDVVVPVSLQSIQITGANSVDENTKSNFLATAFFSDGSTSSVTASAAWSENSALASINSNGQLTAGDVPANQVVTVSASYFYAGVTKSATKNVTIVDVPVIADLTSIRILGANSVVGGQTRQYTIEATFSNGTKDTLTSAATWAENSSFATITQSGLLNTQSVDVDRPVTISASYETDGITKTNTLLVQITPKKEVNIVPLIFPLLFEEEAKHGLNAHPKNLPYIDSDFDGISNFLEQKYGLNSQFFIDGAFDTDNDGFSNIEEVQASSDLTDRRSKPKTLSGITVAQQSQALISYSYSPNPSLIVDGGFAYVMNGVGLSIYDISGNAIQLVSTLPLDGYKYGIEKSGDLVYVANGEKGLRIVDVSSVAAPNVIGIFSTGDFGHVQDVTVQGEYAFIAYNGGGGLNVVDVSDPASPSFVDKDGRGGFGFSKVSGDHVFVNAFGGDDGLLIFKLNSSNLLELVGQYVVATNQYFTDVAIQGNYAYLLENDDGVTVLDISTISSPQVVSEIAINDNNVVINAFANYLEVTSSNSRGISIYDVSDKTAPRLLRSFNPYEVSAGSQIHDEYIYVLDRKGLARYSVQPQLLH
jgi:hypothetical protein